MRSQRIGTDCESAQQSGSSRSTKPSPSSSSQLPQISSSPVHSGEAAQFSSSQSISSSQSLSWPSPHTSAFGVQVGHSGIGTFVQAPMKHESSVHSSSSAHGASSSHGTQPGMVV